MMLVHPRFFHHTEQPVSLVRVRWGIFRLMASSLLLLGFLFLVNGSNLSLAQSKTTSPQSTEDFEPTTTNLIGGVTSLKVRRGRSQIVKFAQAIARVSIADPTLADVIPLAPDQFMINGLQRGVTSLIVWDDNGQEGIFDLFVENDTSELLEAVNTIAPNEQIQAHITDDSFILSGRVSSSVILDEIRQLAGAFGYREENFVDLTETPVPQVILDVKVAEVSRSTSKDLRYGWAHSGQRVRQTRAGSIATGSTGVIGQLPAAESEAGGLLGAWDWKLNQNITFQNLWQLMEIKGKITTLAEPKLVCTHGRKAEFLAGGEFPFIAGVDQNGSPIIEFKDFGVILNFTPWIAIRSGRVELKVEPEVSALDVTNCVGAPSGTNVCGILTRRTLTTVELADGESLLISGILTREEQNSLTQVPWIGDVPILGNFFKNSDLQKSDKELIVVVTPHIVKPGHYGKILGGGTQP